MSSTQKNASQVCTYPPSGSGNGNRRWMGELGHVTGLQYDFAVPGGADALSFTISQPAMWRTDAINPGRITEVWRGGSRIWEGILDEPVPGDTGWSVTAHGAGQYGGSFMAEYTTWTLDNVLDRAINRGLRWRKPALGNMGWMQSVANNASITITDFLNNATTQAGLIWNVDCRQGNLLSITNPPPPNTPDRILVCTVPNPRTLAAGLNRLWYTYVSSDDGSGNQVDTTASVMNSPSIALHGPQEQLADMTQAGLITAQAAQSNASNIINQYVRANWSNTFTVRRGQYLTIGGSPVDLGTETAYPHVARIVLTDGSYGGEVIAGPINITVAKFEYDDDSQTAQITPYQSYKSDLATLLTAVVPALRQ